MNKKLAVLVYKYQSRVWKSKEQINCKSITTFILINQTFLHVVSQVKRRWQKLCVFLSVQKGRQSIAKSQGETLVAGFNISLSLRQDLVVCLKLGMRGFYGFLFPAREINFHTNF